MVQEGFKVLPFKSGPQNLIFNNGAASDINKKGHFLQKNNPYSNLFLKVLQQNKFFLTFHEREQRLKVGHTFCLN